MKRATVFGLGILIVATGYSAPLTPVITGYDFNFGAFNSDGPIEWNTNGLAPDTLDFVASSAHTEVTAFWPAWPAPPTFPVFNAAGAFGADLELHAMFTGQDAPYVGPGGVIDVSLTGTGGTAGAPDLMIFGSIPGLGIPFGLLWAIDLNQVSLYGYSSSDAYVLEGAGIIVGGDVPQRYGLIGQQGVMRGNLDFLSRPAGWIPPLYNPLTDPRQLLIRADYSGETGKGYPVPEPATFAAFGLGVAAVGLLRRRRIR